MQTVIGDMMSAYPSESYGIIFGSHGSGWLPTITGTRSIGQDGGRYSSDTALDTGIGGSVAYGKSSKV